MEIAENVRRVLDEIGAAAAAAGRPPEDVLLLAASKMNDTARVREAFAAGVAAFGENRVQEMTEKLAQGAYDGAQLHFIGHLQRNKVKNVVGVCDLIQSVDSRELLERISARAVSLGIVQDVLLEVNIGGEAAKSGAAPAEADELCACAAGLPGLRVRGLMTIPPISGGPGGNRKFFDAMYNLFVDIGGKKYDNVNMQILSMGMSGDFCDAIAAGANLVRIGTAIFGSRA